MTNQTEHLAKQFKALAEPMRMRLVALCGRSECSVSELTEVIGLSQPRISQHLKQLCDAGILQRFRDGKWVFYRVTARRSSDSTSRRRLLDLIPTTEAVFATDLSRLQELRGDSSTGRQDKLERLGDRVLYKALVELTVTTQLGDLLDIGCGRGQILKLLGTRANHAVGLGIATACTERLNPQHDDAFRHRVAFVCPGVVERNGVVGISTAVIAPGLSPVLAHRVAAGTHHPGHTHPDTAPAK